MDWVEVMSHSGKGLREDSAHHRGRQSMWEMCFRGKGIVVGVVVVVYLDPFQLFFSFFFGFWGFFKPLNSRINVIFQKFLLVTGLYFCKTSAV